ncbi:YjiH family protein [Psychrobacter sp. SCQQ22]|uniref:YjiH family protein n=1 Tax=Psychrobacter sp. SCQQ22 TaxID=2792059 RepID=UPI0018CE81D4|nr:YjiH family protein [Psychrobacter sp. SCQQ22]MBH0085665.1 YjiH family protein [Psychrobacter sp. SCQQ22]
MIEQNTTSDLRDENPTTSSKKLLSTPIALIQLIVFSAIGLVMFFVPFTIGEKSTILFDHGATYLVTQQHTLSVTLLFLLMLYGVSKPFIDGSWHKNITHMVMTAFKIMGLILAVMYVADVAPAFMMEKDMLPFLFEKLALPVGMIVPIGALILAFLVGFGLLEMVGVLMQPIMKPIWKTPGSSAIDAVASFVGSYSIGLLITNRVYLQKQYSAREAIIIATGFSTVSAAFMVIVAKTLKLMEFWNVFFWSTLVITFIVTAITARIPPISLFDDHVERPALDHKGGTRLAAAFDLGLSTSRRATDLKQILWSNFRDGLTMAAAIVPSIIAVGLTGLLLAKYTPVFDALGLLLYPFTWLGGLPEPLIAAKGMSAGLAEMFLPALLLSEADILTRYVAGVISISSVLFFSAMIPCVLATEIPVSVGKMIIIWFERVVLSILLAAAFGQLAMYFNWIG